MYQLENFQWNWFEILKVISSTSQSTLIYFVRDLFFKLTGQNLLVWCWTQKTLDRAWNDLSLDQFSRKSAKYDKSYLENRSFFLKRKNDKNRFSWRVGHSTDSSQRKNIGSVDGCPSGGPNSLFRPEWSVNVGRNSSGELASHCAAARPIRQLISHLLKV